MRGSGAHAKLSFPDRIVRQAREHLFAHGYCQCTMDELAAGLGMSKKTLYAHFSSKDDIVRAVLEQLGAEVRAEADALFANRSLTFAEKLRGFLGSVSVSAPRIPVVNNVDVAIVAEPEKIRDSLVRQAASPVRWVETVRKMRDMGVTHVVECGPGKVLAGMTKRIAPELQSAALADRASLEEALKC